MGDEQLVERTVGRVRDDGRDQVDRRLTRRGRGRDRRGGGGRNGWSGGLRRSGGFRRSGGGFLAGRRGGRRRAGRRRRRGDHDGRGRRQGGQGNLVQRPPPAFPVQEAKRAPV